jgi:chorismate dehydratase
MNIRIGYIPYLNMVPFHHGFGPDPMDIGDRQLEFVPMSPRVLGQGADKETIDAGALSLVDGLRLSAQYESLGSYGIGLKESAQSVLLFTNKPMSKLPGICAVTDDTSTSFRLLQVLLEARYGLAGIKYGRIASSMLFDGEADALLLIGDEALRVKKEGIRGLPVVTDLGEEWFTWQKAPFVFARWAARRALRQEVKDIIEHSIQKSLETNEINMIELAKEEAKKRHLSEREVLKYWQGFAYRLTPEHERSIALFTELLAKVCLTV